MPRVIIKLRRIIKCLSSSDSIQENKIPLFFCNLIHSQNSSVVKGGKYYYYLHVMREELRDGSQETGNPSLLDWKYLGQYCNIALLPMTLVCVGTAQAWFQSNHERNVPISIPRMGLQGLCMSGVTQRGDFIL